MGRQAMASDLFTKSGAQGSLSPYAGLGAYQGGAISTRAQAQVSSSKDTDNNVGGGLEGKKNDSVSTLLMTPPNTAPLNQRWSCEDSLDAPSLAGEPLARPQDRQLPGSSDVTIKPEDSETSTYRSQTHDKSIIIADIDQSTHQIKNSDDTAQVSQNDQYPAPINHNDKLEKELLRQAITRHKRDLCRNELVMAQRAISYPGLTTDRVARIPGLIQGIQDSPELRRQVLHSRSACFQFLLLPRDLRATIACHLFETGSLELLRVCSKLHDELEPLIGEHAVCRIAIGAWTHVKPFPLLTAEENSRIDQVQITILRIFDQGTPQESNIEYLSQFARPLLTRSCCKVTIVGYPEQCWKPSARILEILGTYIYFKTFMLDVRIIHPHRLRPRLSDPAFLSTASSSIHPDIPKWYNISQPASWNDLRAAAMLLEDHLGPFHLPRNQEGAVFHPLDFHRELQISDAETKDGGFYNEHYESFYVPSYHGTRPQVGTQTKMLYPYPISNPIQGRAPAPAPAPASARAPTRSSESQSTQAARPIALSQGAEQPTQVQPRIMQIRENHHSNMINVDDIQKIPASQASSYVYAASNRAAEAPNIRQNPTQPLRQGENRDAAYNGQTPLHTVTHSVSWYEPEPPGQQPFMSSTRQPLLQSQSRASNVRAERPRQVTRQVWLSNEPTRPLNQSRLDSTDPIVRYPYAPTRPRVQTVAPSEPSTTTDQRWRPHVPNIHIASDSPLPQLNAPPPQSTTQPPPQHPSPAKPKRRYANPTSIGNPIRTIAPQPSTQPAPPDAHIHNHPEPVNEGISHATPSSRRNVPEHLPARISTANAPTSPNFTPKSRVAVPAAGTAISVANTTTTTTTTDFNSMGQQHHHPPTPTNPAITAAQQQNKKKKGRALSPSPPNPVAPKKPRQYCCDDDDERSGKPSLDEQRRAAMRHRIDRAGERDEGEESERSVEEIEAAVALGWMREGEGGRKGEGEVERKREEEGGKKREEEGGSGGVVVDRDRESSGWRVMDLG